MFGKLLLSIAFLGTLLPSPRGNVILLRGNSSFGGKPSCHSQSARDPRANAYPQEVTCPTTCGQRQVCCADKDTSTPTCCPEYQVCGCTETCYQPQDPCWVLDQAYCSEQCIFKGFQGGYCVPDSGSGGGKDDQDPQNFLLPILYGRFYTLLCPNAAAAPDVNVDLPVARTDSYTTDLCNIDTSRKSYCYCYQNA